MYARDIKGQRLTLAVSGMLWKRSLVMRDEETGSLWSQQLGRAMSGRLKGAELEMLPATMTDWASWRKRNPKSTVVVYSRTAKRFTREMQSQRGKYVLGLEGEHSARAYPYDVVMRAGVVNDQLDGKQVLVSYDPAGASANAFLRQLPGREAEEVLFSADGEAAMSDNLTGSRWDRQSGIAIGGPLKGKMLTRLPGVPSFGKAWKDFHPATTIYGE